VSPPGPGDTAGVARRPGWVPVVVEPVHGGIAGPTTAANGERG